MKKNFLILALSFSLTACASGYHEYAGIDGYKSKKLSENSFYTTFKSKYNPSFELAKDFAMLRSAELCRSINAKYFIVKGQRRFGRRSPYGGFDEVVTGLTVVCINEKPKDNHYNVNTIANSIKLKYPNEF